MNLDIKTILKNYQEKIDRELTNLSMPDTPESLYNPLRYSLLTKGKRIRPILTLIVGKGFGASIDQLMPAALAIETMHTYTLVHDDIMDNDDMRRGKATVHKKWDTNTAILSGDAISTLSFQLILQTQTKNLQQIGLEFTEAMMEICEGQALDVEFENRLDVTIDEYITMITKKTARLLAMSCKVGAMVANCDEHIIAELNNFAIKTGQAFQIQDDLLEILSSQEEMGKSLGSDFASGKKTYPMLLTLSKYNQTEKDDFLTFLKNSNNIIEIRNKFIESGSINLAKQKVETLFKEAKDHLKVCPTETQETLLGFIQFIQKENLNMQKKEIKIENKHGIHTRPATVFVENASKFQCDVYLSYNGERVNGKSIMGLLILAVEPGATIELETEGVDEVDAMEKLIEIIENKFYSE